jgi:hypothetical protein
MYSGVRPAHCLILAGVIPVFAACNGSIAEGNIHLARPGEGQAVQALPAPPPVPSVALCTDSREASIVTVTCRQVLNGAGPDFRAVWIAAWQAAATATLAAGRSHFILTGSGDVVPDTRTPSRICRPPTILASALWAFAASSGNESHTACTPSLGGGVDCTTSSPEPPPPPPEPECTQPPSYVHSVATVDKFEVLTAEEARGRQSDLLPATRRPFEATAVLGALRAAAPGGPPSGPAPPAAGSHGNPP